MHSTKEFLLVLNQKATLLAILLGSAIFFGKAQTSIHQLRYFPILFRALKATSGRDHQRRRV
jgi:hypothetical protein